MLRNETTPAIVIGFVLAAGWIGCDGNGRRCNGLEPHSCAANTMCLLFDPVSGKGGVCALPPCLNPDHFLYEPSWGSDMDLEPNNLPEEATELPCGGSVYEPDYLARCPTRDDYLGGLTNLVICPDVSDDDVYKIYLLPGETVRFSVAHQYGPLGDLDAEVTFFNAVTELYEPLAAGLSTNDDETLTLTSVAQEGWYYLHVYGKTSADGNIYSISYTLNPVP